MNAVIHPGWRYLPAAILSIALAAPWASPTIAQNAGSAVAQQPELAAAMVQYRRALEEYNRAWQSYTAASSAYWNLISEKRQLRNAKRARGEPVSISDYVLTQPPVYTGPPKPRNPLKPEVPPPRIYVPVVADFVAAARQEFKFVPAYAAGGPCPNGANYLNSSGSLATLASLGVTNCYYIASNGSDSNSGATESSPWLHSPGMAN